MKALDSLAAHYVQQANQEKNKDKKRELFTKATLLYTTADKIIMYDQVQDPIEKNYSVSNVLNMVFLYRTTCWDEPISVYLKEIKWIKQMLNSILYLISLRTISLHCLEKPVSPSTKKIIVEHWPTTKRHYAQIQHVLQVLSFTLSFLKVICSLVQYFLSYIIYNSCFLFNFDLHIGVRLGMGHCFLKLGNVDKARAAFVRAIDLDPKCVGALVGLAILDLNLQETDSIRNGVKRLSTAYTIDSTNPMVLNHLANHFFFKKVQSNLLHDHTRRLVASIIMNKFIVIP